MASGKSKRARKRQHAAFIKNDDDLWPSQDELDDGKGVEGMVPVCLGVVERWNGR